MPGEHRAADASPEAARVAAEARRIVEEMRASKEPVGSPEMRRAAARRKRRLGTYSVGCW
jgi:hypothetical protein